MGPRRSPGFTIVEILVVLAIVGILLAMAMALTRGLTAAQKRSLTATRIAAVDAALVQFVMQQRRLPFPADGTIATGMPNAGVEACGTATQVNGVVPWTTLGLGETDATDGWDRRLTYRAHPTLVTGTIMDMSQCDPAGAAGTTAGACTPGCTNATVAACTSPTNYLTGKGLTIQSSTGAILMQAPGTGAAYVVISHGESGGGAFTNAGQVFPGTTADGTEEVKNYPSTAVTQPYYVDDSIIDAAGASHFDDIVSRPSVLAVISKAALGPRSH